MADITAKDVKALRDQTGAGMMDCKKALAEAEGDIEKAIEILRVKGQAQAAKRGERAASARASSRATSTRPARSACSWRSTARRTSSRATTTSRSSPARSPLQIAAAAPLYVSEDEVPEEDRERELRIFEEQAADKPENVRPKIAEGKLRSGSRRSCCSTRST